MNHLAHVFLAPDTAQARVGSILGDFTRGVELESLPEDVRRGVEHHRMVDSFTDRHDSVLASKRLFSARRRRFAGVALDILYDHFLLKHWYAFSDQDPDTFIMKVYDELESRQHLMPLDMARVTSRMVTHDWFNAYRSLDNIGQALDRVAARIRFPNRFEGMILEIRDHHDELEAYFLEFFPELEKVAQDF